MPKRLTKEEFIEKAKKIHGEKYDYSKVDYVNNHTKVCIICSKHGIFKQTPHDHLSGYGCRLCANENNAENFKSNKDDFIKKAKKIHGDKYDYSKVEYINSQTKVCITCPEHGEFWQTPNNHLHYGCNKCGYKQTGLQKREGKNNIIRRSIKTHGHKYDYSLVSTDVVADKIKIICPIHGIFEQKAIFHINGGNCPKCNSSRLEQEIETLLDEHNIKFIYRLRPKWLNKMELDFYLPQYNIAIECQGRQHYEPISYFGGQEGFEYCLKRDKLKKKICDENNITLLYYTNYEKIDENGNIYKNKDKLLTEIKCH